MLQRIIVLGMPRSGTSLTAELVRCWGAYAGPEHDLMQADPVNTAKNGYMEYLPLQELNDKLLDHNDAVPLPAELLAEKATDPVYRVQALQLIEQMEAQAGNHDALAWVWKDARLPLVLPFWTQIWGDVTYVVTVRHPVESVLSMAKWMGFPAEQLPLSAGFIYWQFCMLNILRFTQNSQRKIFMAYDQLTCQPHQECLRLAHFLNEFGGQSLRPDAQKIDAMVNQVDQGQRRHRYEKSFAEIEQATKEQRALYDFLRVKTICPAEAFNKDDFALYPGWREYLESMFYVAAHALV